MILFALGMLTMLAIILIIVIVVGFVKVVKLMKDVNNLFRDLESCNTDINNRFVEVGRNANDNINYLSQKIENNLKEANSYTDKRIDKLNK